MAESYRYTIYKPGQKDLIEDLAYGFDAFANRIAERVRSLAPYGIGVHPPRGKKRPPLNIHYRNTIRATTWLFGERIAGKEVRTPGTNPARREIQSVVYTTYAPFGHIYEVTGAAPHDIPVPVYSGNTPTGVVYTVHHPGVSKQPHFVPGLLATSGEAGIAIQGKVLSRRGHK